MNKTFLATITGLILTGVMCVFVAQGAQNKAINFEEQVRTANSDIEIQEKRRVDLVYNLADTVKQYDKHEAETLKAIVDGRSKQGDIENVNTLISAVTESYPQLKSNDNYKQLMNELTITENLIAEHRTNYNTAIRSYNRYIKKFPNKQLLSLLGYENIDFDYLEFNAPSDAPQNLFGDDEQRGDN